ncbi:hypothetical protein MCU_01100 [Bartonella elizabethae Re6043vi]|uniref:Uncharacterized protein n=2 Tax=Bartonella elizabethae TaxID=807 RepID=J1A5I5_BAREL|nr:hypothetical protein [Bartonella elizabethae]EJF83415.1 hypothetical protein MCU_01100 [Bartonella elizabethae Re6043vi]EJF96983.1 hypothetical protein MEE_00161 [Bartonella elizabethae F9251 = ATCC 49927]VEJ42152.1 Uncharacterised protein [Bartonella elizabethae]
MFKFLLCFLLLFPFISYAQEKKQETDNPPLISPLIANYPLTEDLLLKLEKIENECKNLPPEPETKNTKSDFTTDNDHIEGYVAYISSKRELVNILRENNFTPKDFVVVLLALQATLNVLTNEENSIYNPKIIPSSNIEFAKKHMYRIIKILKGNC